MVFQNLLLDCDENVLQCSQRVWRLLLQVGYTLRLALEVISYRVVELYPALSFCNMYEIHCKLIEKCIMHLSQLQCFAW